MSKRDPFDLKNLRVDPSDPRLKPRADAPKKQKSKWEKKFVSFPWTWVVQLKTAERIASYKLAQLLIYEHWRNGHLRKGGRPIKLTSALAAEVGVISRQTKRRALVELEQLGLIKVERRLHKSPLITVLISPKTRP